MDLPKNIQEQADKARKLQEDYIKEKTGEKEPAPGSEEAQAFKQDSAQVEEVDVSDEEPIEQEEEEEAPEKEQKDQTDEEETWESRYKALIGKYNAEVPRYAAEVRELKQELRELREESRQPQKSDAPEMGDLDPNAYEEYGEDMKKLAIQTTQLMKQVKELREENKSLRQGVDKAYESTEKMSYDGFLDKVRKSYPAFDQQDTDPEFLKWVDDMGIDLKTIGQERNVKKAVEVYKAFSNMTGKYQPKEEKKTKEIPKDVVKKQVAPPKSRPAPPEDKGKDIWTREDISNFYRDLQKGKYSQEEGFKIKQKIFKAQSEGNVR